MVNDLIAMGFEEARSKRALKAFRNNINLVTDHLLHFGPDMDDEILGPDIS